MKKKTISKKNPKKKQQKKLQILNIFNLKLGY